MKTRNGFVSNSSSSSFIVIYKPTTIAQLDDPDFTVVGKGLCDGIDFFTPNTEMKNYIRENHSEGRNFYANKKIDLVNNRYVRFIIKKLMLNEGESSLADLIELIKNDSKAKDFMIEAFEVDYHTTESLDDLKYHYGKEED